MNLNGEPLTRLSKRRKHDQFRWRPSLKPPLSSSLATVQTGCEISVDTEQAYIARDAFRHYGKGRHPAGLNFGACFAYALAKALDEPLLFKGDDFTQTDIVPCANESL